MTHATGGTGGLPTSYINSVGSSQDGEVTSDSNWPSIMHALCACGAIILLMPTGVVFLRLSPRSVRWHWVNQTLSSIIAIIGIFIGFYLSTMFIKSESCDSTHQVLGILILLAILAQWGMGSWHHLSYKRTKSPTKFGMVHRYFGHIIVFVAIFNGGIGLVWSYASHAVVVAYSVVVTIIGLGLIAVFGWARWNSKLDKKGYIRNPYELRVFQNGYGSSDYMIGDSDKSNT